MFCLQMEESSEEERWHDMLEEMEKKSAKDRKQQVLDILYNNYILLERDIVMFSDRWLLLILLLQPA